jgi:hypothetical protein
MAANMRQITRRHAREQEWLIGPYDRLTKRGDSTDCTGNHDVMAGQVRPGMAEPVSSWALRVRHNDQAPFSKFHQGPRRRPHLESGCGPARTAMAAIVTFLTSRNERLANRGRPCITGRRIDVLAGGLRPPARTLRLPRTTRPRFAFPGAQRLYNRRTSICSSVIFRTALNKWRVRRDFLGKGCKSTGRMWQLPRS